MVTKLTSAVLGGLFFASGVLHWTYPTTTEGAPLMAVGSHWTPDGRLGNSNSAIGPDGFPLSENEVIQQYCTRCHNDRRLRGNLSLVDFDATAADQEPETAERIIRKLRAGMMPPAGVRRPEEAILVGLAASMEAQIDKAAATNPNPGSRIFQRLNRAEYATSIQALLDLDINAGDYLPLDTKSANFDNIADAQLLSPTLMDAYLRGAGEISRLAVGNINASAGDATYKVSRWESQREHVEGAPFGTRGGTSVIHNFPADGEYVIKVSFHHETTGTLYGNGSAALHTAEAPEVIEVSINGEPKQILEIDRWMHVSDPTGVNMQTEPIFIAAGPQRVSAVFVRRFDGPQQDLISPHDWSLASTSIAGSYGFTSLPHLRDMVISGPYDASGISESPSRIRIFSCRPIPSLSERACGQQVVERLGTQAYRRPLSAKDISDLMVFFDEGMEETGFEEGVRFALEAIIASPHFIFRFEEVPEGVKPGENYRISDLDLASRLSYFLWASPPDAELREIAAAHQLSDPRVLKEQVDRLLADPRSSSLATRFAAQWLRLQDLEKINPDVRYYPDFHQQLKRSMLKETELFFESLVREDQDIFTLLTADYTYLDERLARHYGIQGITGNHFRRVALTDPNRRGLLGHGSVLTLTSHADRTSAVLRGKWVMEVFLGSPPPPPPPDVPDLEATEGVVDGQLLTVRERMELHRANPACEACHKMMDPIGLALENFDVTGRWRIKDNGLPIDPSGELFDGTPLNTPADLREALLLYPEALMSSFTENLMAYALGRRVEYFDMPAVRGIVAQAEEDGNRISSLIWGIVQSEAFQMGRADLVDSDGDR